jgi:hypothetical protein
MLVSYNSKGRITFKINTSFSSHQGSYRIEPMSSYIPVTFNNMDGSEDYHV